MNRFTKYFGGVYMKYWYVAFAVIIICMAVSFWNDRNVRYYDLYIYNPDGSVKTHLQVDGGYYERERADLPVEKMFVPKKPL